ncbi:MAG: aspartate 1-decarboxylase [Micavibrio sp.]|nr:MAG: aspartate 1-decarboxylase [Micavibrio sp.]
MLLTMLKTKIHRAKVTESDLNYEGSISIDRDLMDRGEILPYEQVDILNINNGHRFTTYAIEAERGSGKIGINGAAARLAQKDDLVIICAYGQIEKEMARNYKPTVILMNEDNTIKSEY